MQPQSRVPVSSHAKEIMAQLIPLRQGYTPDAIASEAFQLARAFSAEEAKVNPTMPSDATDLRPASDSYARPMPEAIETTDAAEAKFGGLTRPDDSGPEAVEPMPGDQPC